MVEANPAKPPPTTTTRCCAISVLPSSKLSFLCHRPKHFSVPDSSFYFLIVDFLGFGKFAHVLFLVPFVLVLSDNSSFDADLVHTIFYLPPFEDLFFARGNRGPPSGDADDR